MNGFDQSSNSELSVDITPERSRAAAAAKEVSKIKEELREKAEKAKERLKV